MLKKTEKEKITEKDLTFQLPSINNEIIDTYTIITNKVYKLNDIEIKKPFAIKNKKSYSHYLINNEMKLEIKNKIKLAITIPKKWSKNTSKKHNNFSTKNLKKTTFPSWSSKIKSQIENHNQKLNTKDSKLSIKRKVKVNINK